MRALKTLVVAVGAVAAVGACGPSPAAQPQGQELVQRRSAVRGKKPIVEEPTGEQSACTALYSGAAAQAALTQAVVDPGLTYGEVGTLILSFNSDDAVAPALSSLSSTLGLTVGEDLGALRHLPMVALTAPITPELVPTLTQTLQPYGLLSVFQDRPLRYFLDQSVAYIQADVARTTFQTTGRGVGVAVIDSGIDGTHGDFPTLVRNVKVVAPVVSAGVDGALYVDTPNSDLTSGHGTHVASTIAGSGAMSGGRYQGVAPGASLVGVGAGDAISILYSLEAFDFVLDPDVRETHNVRVISNSWGTSGSHFAPFDPVSIASKRAYDLGMVVTFAAGNDGPGADTLNPYSASPCVISVAAGHHRDVEGTLNPLAFPGHAGELADFSSRGIPGDALHHPDITLPGVNVVAARATTGTVVQPFTGFDTPELEPAYAALSGTSMATPHLSGLVALMLEVNPALDLDGVLAALTSTARPMYTEDAATGVTRQHEPWEVGAGYADAYAAVRAAAATAGTRTTVSTTALPGWTGSVDAAVTVPLAGTSLVSSEHVHLLDVPTGASALRIRTDWGNPALDLDLEVYGPSGALVATSAQGASAFEAVTLPSPPGGTYRVRLAGYLNTPTTYTGTAEVDQVVPLP